jgi:hypothetical protein
MEPVTPERINRAVTWYRQNEANIRAALPLQTPGQLFKAEWPEALERSIALWEAGSAPVNLAATYIHRPIFLVAKALAAQARLHHQHSSQANSPQEISVVSSETTIQ